MTEPYIGEIQIFGFGYPPRGWAFCNGVEIAIRQNTSLFSLIGTVYGGNGTTTFRLPNLASRQACSSGAGPNLTTRPIGEAFGAFTVALTPEQLPAHSHGMNIYTGATETVAPSTASGLGTVASASFLIYAPLGTETNLNPAFVQAAGANEPHANIQPFLGLNFSIALEGTFPSFA
jgi:microcystin-dependent protein